MMDTVQMIENLQQACQQAQRQLQRAEEKLLRLRSWQGDESWQFDEEFGQKSLPAYVDDAGKDVQRCKNLLIALETERAPASEGK